MTERKQSMMMVEAMLMNTAPVLPLMVMLFVRAVWNENGKEMEGTIPDAWVNVAEKTLRWPKTRAKYCFDNHVAPKEDWETFPLVKVKFTSESLRECEEHDHTSHAEQLEDEDEDGEVVVQKRKKKTKTFEDFVEGSDLCEASAEGEDKEEWKGDASPIIPVFPTPPIKISKNVGRDRSNSGSPRSAGSDRSTRGSPRSAGSDRSTRGSPRSAGRDRSTSGSPRSAGRDRSTSGSPRSAGRDRSTRGSPRSVGRDRSTRGSSRSRSVGRDSSSGRVPRSQAVESRSLDGLSHARPIYNRAVPTTFPLSEAKFQKIVVTKLVTLTDEVKKLQRTLPNSGIDISKIDTLEEFEREEASLLEKNKFETLVCQLARVGGKDVKDCTHKVMDRLFTNQLMTFFNMKGKGKKDKIGIEDKKLFSAIKAAVMKWDPAATEAQIKSAAADHLKHAPGRVGGGGYK
ncbi:uncharacterized protein LOC119887599 isoform X1 [Micropterus salmoides]|uniref:uncharacterized protein LOC119887599 isoform X1 n=2 Tax=Micropterus salmoides TaxID=27706 RepID=UPI0018EB5468|nr:uncharacterized protein LOC119887599 isoform X1 [Micropterus salmoides]XP_038554250.1 uncharacterized protein LOC119887599 isoform X1 [Micropterus salmoides]